VKLSSRAKIPADVLTYRLNRLPAWVRNYVQDAMGREGAETIMELADLRWQQDALIKLVEELQRELRKEKARRRVGIGHSTDLDGAAVN
jgi:hypothetical protein